MLLPSFRTGKTTILCKKINDFFNSALYRFLLKPIFIVFPVSYVVFLLSKKEFLAKICGYFPESIGSYLLDSQVIIIAVVFLLMQIGIIVEGLIERYSKPDCELSRDDLNSILYLINEVVTGKMKRFLSATKIAIKDKWPKEKIFSEITQPDQQITLQIKAVHGFFEYYSKNEVSFRIGLMRIKEKRPAEWAYFYPEEHPPKVSIETLSSPTSSIMRAIEHERTIIVQDIKAEIEKKSKKERNYVKGSSTSDNSSIITYPIYCPNTKEPIYVLSVYAKKKDFFLEKNKDLYDWILNNFLTRILIEHHLLIMKEEIS